MNALDLTGAPESLRPELECAAAETVTRVLASHCDTDWNREPGIRCLSAFTELKTAWHPAGT